MYYNLHVVSKEKHLSTLWSTSRNRLNTRKTKTNLLQKTFKMLELFTHTYIFIANVCVGKIKYIQIRVL